jgi:hypothetical protein
MYRVPLFTSPDFVTMNESFALFLANDLVLTKVSVPDTLDAAALNSFTVQPYFLHVPLEATEISYLVLPDFEASGALGAPDFGFSLNLGAEKVMPSISTRMPSVP